MAGELSWRQMRVLGIFVRRFPQAHLGIGLLGNGVFIVGTVLFMADREDIGVWFFLLGSCGMFLGTLGEMVRIKGRRRLERVDADPVDPSQRWSETGRPASLLD